MKITIEGIGIREFVARCKFEPLVGKAWIRTMKRFGGLGMKSVKLRAPHKTGRLSAGLELKMQATTIPLWLVITDNAENRGARYPFMLDAGKGKTRAATHYQSGAKTGRPTFRWFFGVRGIWQKHIPSILKDTAKDIEKVWRG